MKSVRVLRSGLKLSTSVFFRAAFLWLAFGMTMTVAVTSCSQESQDGKTMGEDSLSKSAGAPQEGTTVLDSGQNASTQPKANIEGRTPSPPPVQPAPTAGNRCDQDYLIVPGVRAGNVFLNMGYEQVKACVGENNMLDGDAPYGAGTTVEGTYLYPGTPQELFLAWAKPDRKQIEFVRVATPNSTWRTKGGLKIGQTIEAVETMNGRYFTLMGSGDEKSGAVVDWRGGNMEADVSASGTSKQFIRFELPTNMDAASKNSKRLASKNATLRQPSVVLTEMRIGIMKPVE